MDIMEAIKQIGTSCILPFLGFLFTYRIFLISYAWKHFRIRGVLLRLLVLESSGR